jgi:hypothetical protein
MTPSLSCFKDLKGLKSVIYLGYHKNLSKQGSKCYILYYNLVSEENLKSLAWPYGRGQGSGHVSMYTLN